MLKYKNNRPQSRAGEAALSAKGIAALERGAHDVARDCFQAAIRIDGKNAETRYQFALSLAALGKRTEAAEQLTIALSIDPHLQSAARELNAIFDGGILPGSPRLDPSGLVAALAFDTIDRDLLSAAIYHHLTNTEPLRSVIELGRREGWHVAADEVCLGKSRKLLTNKLLLAVLPIGLVARRDLECLLTAIRRHVLVHPALNLARDSILTAFAETIARQCWLNEFVWAETPEERAAVDAIKICPEMIAVGDAVACHALVRKSLYRCDFLDVTNKIDYRQLAKTITPDYAEALQAFAKENDSIRSRGATISSLSPVTDSLSRNVAEQYEHHPYPRWTSVPVHPRGGYLNHLQQHFRQGQLAFARQPFEVLIAGCGTGRQAVSAALDYGPNARVVGFDISRRSLGYASLMAERMGVTNLTLARGDINRIASFEPSLQARFHVVECTGVLHHMADPFAAWRSLLGCLAPGGIMLIGLYSRTARQNLSRMKEEPGFPGASADDDALRAYRQELAQRPDQWPGVEYTSSRDFYSASGFRDFFLHVNEQAVGLPDIAAFLEDNGLEFRGFVAPPFTALKSAYPAEIFPGTLSRWAQWEASRPRAFVGMYQFWCTRK